jgi:hypothetical protein
LKRVISPNQENRQGSLIMTHEKRRLVSLSMKIARNYLPYEMEKWDFCKFSSMGLKQNNAKYTKFQ